MTKGRGGLSGKSILKPEEPKNSGLMNRRKKEADRFRGKGGSND